MDGVRLEDLLDRQRLRRKLGFWRILTLIAAFLAVILITLLVVDPRTLGETGRPHVARIVIDATITDDEELLNRIARIRKNDNAEGVVVTVNSPGGTTTGGEAVYEAIRELAETKPTVSQIGTLAASAGYMVAVASDHVVARQSSIVGSIGVIFQYPNVEGLLDAWGIDVRAIKSTPLKAEPNFFGETPPGAEEMIRAMILDSFDWFKDLVAERRDFDTATINELADGSVFTGRQALELGMVDALGGVDEAQAWLEENGVAADLKVVTYKRPSRNSSNILLRASTLLLGNQGIADPRLDAIYDRVFLDGLLSVWHGD